MAHHGAMPEELLTIEQAAQLLQLHPDTVRRLVREGELPGVKIGRRQWRIATSALQRYIERGSKRKK